MIWQIWKTALSWFCMQVMSSSIFREEKIDFPSKNYLHRNSFFFGNLVVLVDVDFIFLSCPFYWRCFCEIWFFFFTLQFYWHVTYLTCVIGSEEFFCCWTYIKSFYFRRKESIILIFCASRMRKTDRLTIVNFVRFKGSFRI